MFSSSTQTSANIFCKQFSLEGNLWRPMSPTNTALFLSLHFTLRPSKLLFLRCTHYLLFRPLWSPAENCHQRLLMVVPFRLIVVSVKSEAPFPSSYRGLLPGVYMHENLVGYGPDKENNIFPTRRHFPFLILFFPYKQSGPTTYNWSAWFLSYGGSLSTIESTWGAFLSFVHPAGV